jgi:hypothetical protein
MSTRSKFTLFSAIAFTTVSIILVLKMKSDSLKVRQSSIERDDLVRSSSSYKKKQENLLLLQDSEKKRTEYLQDQSVTSN